MRQRVPLSSRCTLELGGEAWVHPVTTVPELVSAAARAAHAGESLRVLGGGSNVVISDAGISDLVLDMQIAGRKIEDRGDTVLLELGAGEIWDEVVAWTVSQGWAGLECLSGIPGRVGATPIQNVGAYGQEVSETLTRVEALDLQTQQLCEFSSEECGFAYRDSHFKSRWPRRHIVSRVWFELKKNAPPTLRYADLQRRLEERAPHGEPSLELVRDVVVEVRRSKSMVWDASDPNRRSCGSFFTNPIVSAAELAAVEERAQDPKMPRFEQPDGRFKLAAAWLIQHSGLNKGLRDGPVGLSTAHTLQLVCHQGASARDVVRFAWRVRRSVESRFGVRLVPEPVFWGFDELDDGLPLIE